MGFHAGIQTKQLQLLLQGKWPLKGSCHGDWMGLNGVGDELQSVGFV